MKKEKEFQKILNVKELPLIIDVKPNQMVYLTEYSDSDRNARNRLFRLKTISKYVIVKKYFTEKDLNDDNIRHIISSINDNIEKVRYAFRYTMDTPCEDMTGTEIFLQLFTEAVKKKNNAKPDMAFVEFIKKAGNDYYKTDENFITPRWMAKKEFSEECNKGRFKKYSDIRDEIWYITEIKNTVHSKRTEISLEEAVFPSLKNGEDHWSNSVALRGKGGSGKTFQFLHLIDKILSDNDKKYENVIPLYIELASITVHDAESVINRLAVLLNISPVKVKILLKENNWNVILFCDGLNEVTDLAIKNDIAKCLASIRFKYKTRIVLSSRDDHTRFFKKDPDESFDTVYVSDLSETQIKKFFKECKMPAKYRYDELPLSTKNLLKTVQGLAMYTALVLKDNTFQVSDMGHLLQEYVNRILAKSGENDGRYIYSFEKILKKIGYYMAGKGWFYIKETELRKIISDEEYYELKGLEHSQSVFTDYSTKSYKFTHQNFRDYYAALYLSENIQNIDRLNAGTQIGKYLINNDITNNNDVLMLCADLLPENAVNTAIDSIRNSKINDYGYALSLLVKLHAAKNDNNISDLDLSDLDLREVCLSTYALYKEPVSLKRLFDPDTKIENNCKYRNCVDLDGATISDDTFLQVGLRTASSTICSYEYDLQTYVAAFSSTNVLLYNANANKWRCIRALDNHGWINTCCVTEIGGKLCVLLGCESGDITVFDPESLTVTPFYENKTEKEIGIDSIIEAGTGENKKLLYSDSDGNVYIIRDRDNICIRKSSEDEIEEVKKLFKLKSREIFDKRLSYEKKLKPTARLTKSDDSVFLCFGSRIYSCDLPVTENSRFGLYHEYKNDTDSGECTVIRDMIHTGKGLLINKLSEIAFISKRKKNEYKINAVDNAHKSQLEYFTKFSPTLRNDLALIGISAINSNYSEISNICAVYGRSKPHGYELPRTKQKMVVHTGVEFYDPHKKNRIKLAAVSDDRSVQIIVPDEENTDTVVRNGAFNGVRYIDFIDEQTLLAAQYDGNVTLWHKKEDDWSCYNVYNLHNDWTWKVISSDSGRNYNTSFFTCSYDGTLKRVRAFDAEQTTLIKSESDEELIDFVVSGDFRSVTAISENCLYCKQGSKRQVKYPLVKEKEWSRCKIRSIDSVNDIPYIAINASLNDGGERSYVKSFSDKKFHDEFVCESTCKFVKNILIEEICGKTIMAVYGTNGDTQYFAFYRSNGRKWEFCGSSKPESNSDFKSVVNLTSDEENAGSVSSMAIRTNTARFENGVLTFEVYAAHFNSVTTAYRVEIGEHETIINEIPSPKFNHKSAPLCIKIYGDTIAVGLLNGLVTTNDLKTPQNDPIDFRTHAKLRSCIDVTLPDVVYENDEKDRKFHRYFKGYFDFCD